MAAEKFSFTELKRLIKDGQLKELQDAKNYILRFFYPLTNGMVMFANGGVKKMLSTEVFRTTYASRFGKELLKWFVHDTVNIYDIIIDTHKPFICEDSINTFAGFKHTEGKEFSKRSMKGRDMMLDFIKQVWCNNNEDSYNYVLNWLANMIQGNKNNTILYLKSFVEGIGKSTVTQFILYHVLGKDICIESNSDVLKSSFNEILSGKLMVVFEELESACDRDWQIMSTKLKRWSTSNEVIYSDKYIKSYESNNINNYIINTNVEAIKASEGRRYYILDLSTQYKNNHEYFNKLYETCFNDEVGKSFYQFMTDRDIKKFNPQNFTETQAKKIAQSDRLHPLCKFIKFNYILDNRDMKIMTKELYDEYLQYVALTNSVNKLTKNKMISLLREHGIDYKTSNGKMSYNVTNAQLREFGNKYKWFFEDDNEEHDENRLIKTGEAVKLVVSPNEAKLQAEIERLNKIIEELKQPKHVEIVHEEEDDDDVVDDGEIEVIHTNVFQPQPQKVKKTQDMNNIISAFDHALLKMKS
jgi:hypothetical protein